MMEVFIDEAILNEFIEMTSFGGELEHRGINATLKQIAMLGYLHRDEHKVVFCNYRDNDDNVYSGIDEDYDEYLDRRASGIEKRNWEDIQND